MLGHLFFRYLPYGTPGFRVNCLSCLCGATATLVLFLFCQRWYASRGYRASCGWALMVAGCWALSPLLWQYHVQAEVFSLNNLIVALQFLLAQIHYEACVPPPRGSVLSNEEVAQRKGRARTMARLGALAVGLGFSNQHAIVFYSFPIVLAGESLNPRTHKSFALEHKSFALDVLKFALQELRFARASLYKSFALDVLCLVAEHPADFLLPPSQPPPPSCGLCCVFALK